MNARKTQPTLNPSDKTHSQPIRLRWLWLTTLAVLLVATQLLAVPDVGGGPIDPPPPPPQSPLTIDTADPMPDATECVSYSLALQGSGGDSTTYLWTATGLPRGLGIDPGSAEISGVPESGTSRNQFYKVQITLSGEVNGNQERLVKSYNLLVAANSGLVAQRTSLVNGVVSQPYSHDFKVINYGNPAKGPFTFGNSSGLPAGVALASTLDPISGNHIATLQGTGAAGPTDIPPGTQAGTYTMYIHIVDTDSSRQFCAFLTFTIQSSVLPLRIDNDAIPRGIEGQPYSNQAIPFGGGIAPYTWTVIDNSGLPPGIQFNSAVGLLNGTLPIGTARLVAYEFEVELSDSNGGKIQQTLSLFVDTATGPVTVPSITTQELADAYEEVDYGPIALTARVSGGTTDWSASTGLPAGLSISADGIISGVPDFGTYSETAYDVTLIATNTTDPSAVSQVTLQISVGQRGPQIATGSLPDAIPGEPYSITLVAYEGVGLRTWKVNFLPAGLFLMRDTIVGSVYPRAAGKAYRVELQVYDKREDVGATTITLPLNVQELPAPSLNILTSYLPAARVGEPYGPVTIQATGGAGVFDWSQSYGLPDGLVISTSGADIVIYGMPERASAGDELVSLVVTDGELGYDSAELPLFVLPAAVENSSTNADDMLNPDLANQLIGASGAAAGCTLDSSTRKPLLAGLLVLLVTCASRCKKKQRHIL